MDVREISRKPVVTCTPAATLQHVASLMRDANVGSVVVVRHGTVAGIVTDRDIATRAVAEGLASSTHVESVMTRDVVLAFEGDEISTAATTMASRALRRLPVLDAHGSVTGMVALDDLVGVFAEQIGKLVYTVNAEVHPAEVHPATGSA